MSALGESITFCVEGTPASKGSYRAVTGRSRKTGKPVTRLIPMDKKERPWRDKILYAASSAMKAIGVRELLAHAAGDLSLDEAVAAM